MGRTSRGHPGVIRADIPAQNFGQGGQNPGTKNKHFGADIHDSKARTSTTLKDFQKLRSEKLWPEFSFPKYPGNLRVAPRVAPRMAFSLWERFFNWGDSQVSDYFRQRKKSTKINFLCPEIAGRSGGLPRGGVVAEKLIPSLGSLFSLGFEGRDCDVPGILLGCPGLLGV